MLSSVYVKTFRRFIVIPITNILNNLEVKFISRNDEKENEIR